MSNTVSFKIRELLYNIFLKYCNRKPCIKLIQNPLCAFNLFPEQFLLIKPEVPEMPRGD